MYNTIVPLLSYAQWCMHICPKMTYNMFTCTLTPAYMSYHIYTYVQLGFFTIKHRVTRSW